MQRRQLIQSLAMTVLGFGTLFLGRAAAATPERLPKGKRLSVGGILRHDEDLSITFLAVLKDSRCPINAICISAGNAEVSLRIKAGNQKPRVVTLSTDGEKNRHITIPANEVSADVVGIPKSYTISITSLSPLPFAGKKTKQSDYRLKLKIRTAV